MDNFLTLPTNEQLHKKSRDNWNKIPTEVRQRCLDHLDGWIDREQLKKMKDYRFDPSFHFFGGGMAIRNRLRDVLPDNALPAVAYPGGAYVHNWDDYYLGAVDELVERLS